MRPDGTPFGWRKFGGTIALTTTPRAEGTIALAFSSQTSSTKWVYQTVTVQGGAHYNLSAKALKADPSAEAVFLRLSWYSSPDGSGAALDRVDSTTILTSDQPGFRPLTTGPVQAPAEARSARARLMLRPASATPASVYFDAVTFLQTEPPTSPSPASPPMPTPTSTPAPEPAIFPSLANGGFEEIRPDGTPFGWRKFGGTIALTTTPHAEGTIALAFSSQTSSTKWAFQTVTVQGGAYYNLSAWALKADPSAAAVFLRLSWYSSPDGSGAALDRVDSTTILTSDQPGFRPLTTGPVRAPAEARTAKVRLMLRPTSAAPATVYFDAVTFFQTGPPTSPSPASTPTSTPTPTSAPTAPPTLADAPTPAPTMAGSSDLTPTPTAELGGDTTPGMAGLANVRAAAPAPVPVPKGSDGRSYDWAVALAVAVPLATMAVATGFERWRRLAGRDRKNL